MHNTEVEKSTNTGRLAHRLLPNSSLHVIGKRDCPADLRALVVPGTTPFVLFPEPSAPELTPEFLAGVSTSITLIVPDGTWTQARRLSHRVPELAGIKRVRIKPGAASRYFLRRNQAPNAVCTIEAIARAIGMIDGIEVQKSLETFFEIMVERALRTRTTTLPLSSLKAISKRPILECP